MRELARLLLVSACVVGLTAIAAYAVDQTILGKSFSVKAKPGGPTKSKVSALEKNSNDTLVGDPTAAGSAGGVILEIFVNGGTPSSQSFVLDQGTNGKGKPFWSGDAVKGFKYSDRKGQQSGVRSLRISLKKRTFKIKASIRGKNGPVSIVPPNPGSSACVAVQLGVDGTSGDRYSVQFGPESNKITNKDGTLFKVTKPVNEGVCPSGPTTTTSTSSTTTTTAPTTTTTTTSTTVMTSSTTTTTTSTTAMTTSSTTTTTTSTTSTTMPTNLNGTFASHVTTTGTISVPLIGGNAANIDIVLRIFNSTSGNTVVSHLEFCRVNTASTNGNLIVNIPTNITALLVNDRTSPVQNLTVGGPVTLPNFNIAVGHDTAGNSRDDDNDGNPGVSIPTLLQGQNETVFSSLVILLSFPSATLTDANTISGQLAVTTSGKVFGGTPLNLTGNLSVATETPTVAFTSTRLIGNVPCSQVLTMF